MQTPCTICCVLCAVEINQFRLTYKQHEVSAAYLNAKVQRECGWLAWIAGRQGMICKRWALSSEALGDKSLLIVSQGTGI